MSQKHREARDLLAVVGRVATVLESETADVQLWALESVQRAILMSEGKLGKDAPVAAPIHYLKLVEFVEGLTHLGKDFEGVEDAKLRGLPQSIAVSAKAMLRLVEKGQVPDWAAYGYLKITPPTPAPYVDLTPPSPEMVDDQLFLDIVQLVIDGVPEKDLLCLSAAERKEAIEWCGLCHAAASDNPVDEGPIPSGLNFVLPEGHHYKNWKLTTKG